MSTNRFETPRAYVDLISYNLANGWRDLDNLTTVKKSDGTTIPTFDAGSEASMFDMRPSNYAQIAHDTQSFYIQFDFGVDNDNLSESNFLAILNHNFLDATCIFKVELDDDPNMGSSTDVTSSGNYTGLINTGQASGGSNMFIQPPKNGWTLITWTQATDNRYMRITFKDSAGATVNFDEDVIIGSIMFGKTVSFPALSLEIETSVDYDGTNLKNSLGGNTYANT